MDSATYHWANYIPHCFDHMTEIQEEIFQVGHQLQNYLQLHHSAWVFAVAGMTTGMESSYFGLASPEGTLGMA
jgi:hypothetical protein